MKQVISVERQNVGTAEVPEIELTSSGRVTIVPIDRIQPNPYLCTTIPSPRGYTPEKNELQ
jgi:hypothetical protein